MDRVRRPSLLILLLVVALTTNLPATARADELPTDLTQLKLADLQARLANIDEQLESLAKPSMRTGIGAVGYRSQAHDAAGGREWIQIELAKPTRIDQIVLVPSIWRDTKTGFVADGFPFEFQVVVSSRGEKNGHSGGKVIAQYTADDHLLPRLAPVVVPCSENDVSWIRIEATGLSPRAWDGKRILQLSEIAIFSEQENVALGQAVEVSSNDQWISGSRGKRFLVDGFVPYMMDAQQGEQSIAFVSEVGFEVEASVSIDLQAVYSLNRIHLHSTDVSDTVPQAAPPAFGIPRNLLVIGGMESDFSDAVPLMEYRMETVFDAGPIIMRRFPATRCRYVRLNVLEPYYNTDDQSQPQFGFAEIELFCQGVNVAAHKPVSTNVNPSSPDRSISALTDGNNLYGQILSNREWLGQLATRHDLETLRPLIAAQLNSRYLQQRTNVNRLILLASFLAIAAISAILIGWALRQRAVLKTRERIAADLHDELGANFHAIGLLSDLAQAASDSPDKLKPLMRRMRELTERAGTAAAYCANLLESKGLYDDLASEMQRSSQRIMADLDHEVTFEGDEFLRQLKPRKRIDLFLFHKECLINIIRHSGATKATTRIVADGRRICLSITDNGRGVTVSPDAKKTRNGIPPSLKRRAQLLGASVSVDQAVHGGTCVTLKMRTKRFGSTHS